MRQFTLFIFLVVATLGSGCAHYVTPSGRANFQAFGTEQIKENFAAVPAAGFPAGIAAVRVQENGYRNYHLDQDGGVYGRGRYSVVLTHEVEDDADVARIAGLPQVGGLISLSRLLLPAELHSDVQLREAAAKLKADLLIIYTFDTSFHDHDAFQALSVVTLGLSPTRTVTARVTASGLIMDTRTGFIYGAVEASEKRQVLSNAWISSDSADQARREAEKVAFHKLVDELVKIWPQVVARAKQGQ